MHSVCAIPRRLSTCTFILIMIAMQVINLNGPQNFPKEKAVKTCSVKMHTHCPLKCLLLGNIRYKIQARVAGRYSSNQTIPVSPVAKYVSLAWAAKSDSGVLKQVRTTEESICRLAYSTSKVQN